MDKILHYIAHLFRLNDGLPVSELDDKGNLWYAFQCGTCGKIQDPYIRVTAQEWNQTKQERK